MKLYGYWRSSSSWRVRIALNLKGVTWENIAVNLRGKAQFAAEHLARNPLGQVPVLEVPGDNGAMYYLGQSMAILEFLDERYPTPPLLPKDTFVRAHVRQLAEIVNSSIQPLQNLAVLNHVKDELHGDDKAFASRYIARGLAAFQHLCDSRAGTYCVGDNVTLADIFLVPQLYSARRFGVALDSLQRLTEIEARLAALPAFAAAHADRQPDAAP